MRLKPNVKFLKEECIVALSTNEKNLVIYSKHKINDSGSIIKSELTVLRYETNSFIIVSEICLDGGYLVNGLDINNEGTKVAIGYVTGNKEQVSIFKKEVESKVYSHYVDIQTGINNILFGYNVLFNNDSNNLLIFAPMEDFGRGNCHVYAEDEIDGYKRINRDEEAFKRFVHKVRGKDYVGHRVKDIDAIDYQVWVNYKTIKVDADGPFANSYSMVPMGNYIVSFSVKED